MAKEKMNYKKMTVDDMVEYILKYDNTAEAKEFINGFYEKKPAKVKLVLKLDNDGKPIEYINKASKKTYKKERIADGKGEKDVYNVLKAKVAFYNRYKDDIDFENPPIKTKDNSNDKIKNALAKLG